MLPFKLVYSVGYYLPLGAHVFPAQKYRLIHQRLLEKGLAAPEDFLEPQPASDDDILLVHTPEYLNKLKTGTLSLREELQLEVPYSPALVEAFWLATGGSIQAAELALAQGVGFNLSGGFHHAFPDHGEGFCVIHDVAVAIRRLQKEKTIERALTVDCDVHHGNGTAAIFANDPSVFTFSIHEEQNYPAVKPPSDRDVGLDTGTRGSTYLDALRRYVPEILDRHRPELLAYVAGADPYEHDQLGGLTLTREELRERDRIVFGECAARGVPVAALLAGGYAVRVEDTVAIHADMVGELFAHAAHRSAG